MDTKTLVKKLNLSDEAFDRIKDSIKNAESKTSGEIVIAVTAESSDYSFWELFAALIFSLAITIAALPFAKTIRAFYESHSWSSPEWYLPAIYGFASFCLILLFFFLFNIPALDRIVIPNFFKRKETTARAMRAFTECGIYSTREHTGILIFVSFLERQVRIVADEGIAKKIGDDLWNIIADSLAAEIGKKNIEGAFCDAVEKCGELLAQYFPANENDNPDELDNAFLILEK